MSAGSSLCPIEVSRGQTHGRCCVLCLLMRSEKIRVGSLRRADVAIVCKWGDLICILQKGKYPGKVLAFVIHLRCGIRMFEWWRKCRQGGHVGAVLVFSVGFSWWYEAAALCPTNVLWLDTSSANAFFSITLFVLLCLLLQGQCTVVERQKPHTVVKQLCHIYFIYIIFVACQKLTLTKIHYWKSFLQKGGISFQN